MLNTKWINLTNLLHIKVEGPEFQDFVVNRDICVTLKEKFKDKKNARREIET